MVPIYGCILQHAGKEIGLEDLKTSKDTHFLEYISSTSLFVVKFLDLFMRNCTSQRALPRTQDLTRYRRKTDAG